MSKHAMLSPSSAETWMTCAGSMRLTHGGIAPLKEAHSAYADEGSAAHCLGATCLDTGVDTEQYRGYRYGRTAEGGEYLAAFSPGIQITDDMLEYVQEYVDAIRSYSFGAVARHIEQRMDISDITGEDEACGTSDAVILFPDQLQIHDLKYGMGVEVSAVENKQLMIYALAALRAYDLIYDFKTVKLVIHQPRKGGISEWECSIETLRAFGTKVEFAANHALNVLRNESEGAVIHHLVASEKGCQWCRAKSICPKLAQIAFEATVEDFDEVKDEPKAADMLEQIYRSPEALADKMRVAPLIKMWYVAVVAAVKETLNTGGSVPGYKLVVGRKGNRDWADEELAENALFEQLGDTAYTRKLISVAATEKLAKKNKDLADVFKTIEVKQKDGQPAVVADTDPREAVSGIAGDFDEVED